MDWEKKDLPVELVKEMASRYGCGPLAASILARRGVVTGPELLYFLETDKRHLRLPFEMPGMEAAVERILQAKEEGEKVLVFGDRDVDGITSTALLAEALALLGLDVSWRIPTGDEAYGLSLDAIDEFAGEGGTLIVTVDCGTSNVAEVARAAELGIDVVITDHHNPQADVPRAAAIVNPKLKNPDGSPRYPFPDLAGCGVAYKLVSALRFALKSELYGQPLCLLNAYPVNDAVVIEAIKTRNLVITDRIEETVTPGVVGISRTRLPAFLEGQQIFCWDLPLQQKILASCFGRGVEIFMADLAPEIAKEIPGLAQDGRPLSLLRLRERSKIARYAEGGMTEAETLYSLFVSFVEKKEHFFTPEDDRRLQLVAIGTVADQMPLLDENRIIVRSGLASLAAGARPGLAELLYKLELAGRPRISATDVGWLIGPAINAAGRMGQPEKAVMLLLEANSGVRERLAMDIIALNDERRRLGEKLWTACEPQARSTIEKNYGGNLAVASAEDMPRGLTGIIAGKLVRRFGVPGLALAVGEEAVVGSLRSARGYDLTALLDQALDFFLDHGGHDYAAGFSVERGRLDAFLERLAEIARNIEFPEEAGREVLEIDAELPQKFLGPDIFKTVDLLEPYGKENPSPLFLARGLTVGDISFMGKQDSRHVKLTLRAGAHKWPAVYWNAADKAGVEFSKGAVVDAVFHVARNWFNGQETPQLVIQDMRAEKK